MTFEEVKKYFGSGYKFEEVTKMSHVNFVNWGRRGFIPIESQLTIQRATNGVLRASLVDAYLCEGADDC